MELGTLGGGWTKIVLRGDLRVLSGVPSGIQRKWLLSSDHWERLNVFSRGVERIGNCWMFSVCRRSSAATWSGWQCLLHIIPQRLPRCVVVLLSKDDRLVLFIIRVNREVKRVYRNGCRYNERLNTETGGSKTPHTHVARVQTLVRSVSENLGWQLQIILEQEEGVRERHWP